MYFNNSRITNKRVYNFIFFAILVVSIRLWSFIYIPDRVFDFFEFAIVFITIILLINKWEKLKRKKLLFSNNVKYFMIIPLISSLGAYLYHKQEFYLSLIELRIILFWLLYFLLHAYNINENQIVKLTIKIGLIWSLINIFQQFTFPFYLFKTDVAKIFQNSKTEVWTYGVVRYRILGQQFGMFLIFFSFYYFLKTKKILLFLYVIIGLFAFYFYGARQFLFCIILCLVLCSFLISGRFFNFLFIFLFIVGFVLFSNIDLIVGNIIKKTTEQLSSEDYIRYSSADFFLNEFWPKNNFFSRFIGNGQSQNLSIYGKEMNRINENFKFFSSDVGIIGGYNKFGVFYVVNVVFTNFKGLSNTFKLQHNKYLLLFFVFAFMTLILSEYYSNPAVIPFYCIIFYLVDIANEQQRSKIQYSNSGI